MVLVITLFVAILALGASTRHDSPGPTTAEAANGRFIDTRQPLVLRWLPGENSTSQHVFVYDLDLDEERVEVFVARDIDANTTTITIPANTLSPEHRHEWFVTAENWRGFAYSKPTQFVTAAPCPADTNNDGVLTPTDFTAWVGAFNTNAPECDQNGDGMCTPTDFSAWIGNYNAGC